MSPKLSIIIFFINIFPENLILHFRTKLPKTASLELPKISPKFASALLLLKIQKYPHLSRIANSGRHHPCERSITIASVPLSVAALGAVCYTGTMACTTTTNRMRAATQVSEWGIWCCSKFNFKLAWLLSSLWHLRGGRGPWISLAEHALSIISHSKHTDIIISALITSRTHIYP